VKFFFNIGITGVGSLIGQAIIKSIKKSKYLNSTLVGFEYFENTIGSYWVDRTYLLPDILKYDNLYEDWQAKIFEVAKNENLNIIFIGVDFELPLFDELKDRLLKELDCTVIISDKNTIDIADDKYLTYCFLKKNNLFYPKTFLPNEALTAIDNKDIDFPMIIKPRKGFRSRNVFIVRNLDELSQKLQSIPEPIIQELVGDEQSEYTCGVLALGDNKKTIALRRKLLDGNTSIAVFKYDFPDIIDEYLLSIADKLNIFGVCNFQLRIGGDGLPKVFEINARHSGTTYMRSLFGFNEVELIIDYVLNGQELDFNLKEGTVKRYFEEFFISD